MKLILNPFPQQNNIDLDDDFNYILPHLNTK